MRGAATPPKWDHSLEPLFDELSKALEDTAHSRLAHPLIDVGSLIAGTG